jgi:hypothetical protein
VCQFLGRRCDEVAHRREEASLIRRRAGFPHPRQGVFLGPSSGGDGAEGRRGRAPMLTVVTVHEHGTRKRLNRLDNANGLLSRYSVVADRHVNVADPETASRFDVRPRTIDADDGFDTEFFEGGERLSTVGLTAAVQSGIKTIGIPNPADLEPLRPRGRPLCLALLLGIARATSSSPRSTPEGHREQTARPKGQPRSYFPLYDHSGPLVEPNWRLESA